MIYKASHILTMTGDTIADSAVLVRDGGICDIGSNLAAAYPDEPVRDLGKCALMPGFVNAHSHIDYTMQRNRHDALNLWDWIDNLGCRTGCFPDYDLALQSAILGATECARSGITCLGDSTFTGAAAEAMSKVGLRGIAYLELFGQSMGNNYEQDFITKLNTARDIQSRISALVRIGLSPHAVYTSNQEVLKLCADSCAISDIPIALHLAETWAEADYTLKGTGPIAQWRARMDRPPMITGLSPTQTIYEAGLLRKGVCLAHCVHVTDDEIDLIAHSEASVAHCPRSNAYLGAGIAPMTRFRSAGATIGLGTDSAGSCMRLDFFEEMRFALGLARAIEQDAAVTTANDVLRMATIGGAETLGLDKCVGTIEVGKRADIVAVDLSDALSEEDPALAIMSRSPSDVKLVLVDGTEIVTKRPSGP
ncbi:MAG: amidohydrolase family protein [Armatimonadota bacterium]|nr:amidohydrolase family protein [bacterium]